MRAAVLLCVFAAACGRGAFVPGDSADAAQQEPPDAAVEQPPDAGQPDAGAPDAGPVLHDGVLSGISGARYQSGATAGRTDAQGRFQWEEGARVSFYAGGLLLAEVTPAALLTPFALSGGCAAAPLLRKLLVLLATLGPGLGALDPSLLAGQKLADVDLASALAVLAPGKAPVAEADALDAFIRAVDSEEWAEESRDRFSGTDAETRSQGVAWTGAGWLFSYQLGLTRTDPGYAAQEKNTAAIPVSMYLQYGTNHIGDVDLHDQALYAPMEDGHAYDHPRVGFYDAQTLSFVSSVALDRSLQPDGVPWVAWWNGQLVTSAWNPAPALNLWDMTGAFLRSIPLRPALGRIQGAKVAGGMMYAARDTTPKTVVKIVLETGTAMDLFTLPDVGEQEGIAVGGGMLHTLDVVPGSTGVELRHHRKTRASIRDQVCPP